MFKNAAEIFAYIKKEDVKLVDVRFTDLPGIQHHFNVPVESFDEAVFTEGLMFDGSSIRGFQTINESDMKLLPVPESAYMDPYRKEKTLIIIFSVHNPVDNSPYSRDPRGVVGARWGLSQCGNRAFGGCRASARRYSGRAEAVASPCSRRRGQFRADPAHGRINRGIGRNPRVGKLNFFC